MLPASLTSPSWHVSATQKWRAFKWDRAKVGVTHFCCSGQKHLHCARSCVKFCESSRPAFLQLLCMPRHPLLSVLSLDQMQLVVVPQHLHEVDYSLLTIKTTITQPNLCTFYYEAIVWWSYYIVYTLQRHETCRNRTEVKQIRCLCNDHLALHNHTKYCSFVQLTESGVAKLLAHHWGIYRSPVVITNSAPSIVFAHLHSPTPNCCTASQSHRTSNTN